MRGIILRNINRGIIDRRGHLKLHPVWEQECKVHRPAWQQLVMQPRQQSYEQSAKRGAKFQIGVMSGRPVGRPVTFLKGLYLQNYACSCHTVFTEGLISSIKIHCNRIGLICGSAKQIARAA